MVMRPNGLNQGKATVRFMHQQSMLEFVKFADGLEINGRKIKASLVSAKKEDDSQKEELQPPRKMM